MIMGFHKLRYLHGLIFGVVSLTYQYPSFQMPFHEIVLLKFWAKFMWTIPNYNTDKLYKLRPMINQLNSNFVIFYNVSHHVSIDWWKHDIVQGLECYKAMQSNETNKKGFQTVVIDWWYGWLFVPLWSLPGKEPKFLLMIQCPSNVFWL